MILFINYHFEIQTEIATSLNTVVEEITYPNKHQ